MGIVKYDGNLGRDKEEDEREGGTVRGMGWPEK